MITSLQTDEQEKQWHYTQLELIAQKIRQIAFTQTTVSLLALNKAVALHPARAHCPENQADCIYQTTVTLLILNKAVALHPARAHCPENHCTDQTTVTLLILNTPCPPYTHKTAIIGFCIHSSTCKFFSVRGVRGG